MATQQILTNSFLGTSHSLQPHPPTKGVHHGALRLAPTSPGSEKENSDDGLLWTISPAFEIPGRYHISTTLPDGTPKRLDLYNDNSGNKTRVCLAKPGYYSGQYWTFTACEEERDDGEEDGGKWYKLSNDWTGPGWFLDTYDGTYEAHMSEGEYSGQRWWITVPLEGDDRVGEPSRCWGAREGCDIEAQKSCQRAQRRYAVAKLVGAVAVGFVMGRLWEKML